MQRWGKAKQIVWKCNLKVPELNQSQNQRLNAPGALPIDWQLINVTECRATGHTRLQRRIDTAEGGAEFSFPAQASPPLPQPPPPPSSIHIQSTEGAAPSRQQIRFHHTPNHSATCTTLIPFQSATTLLLIAGPLCLHSIFFLILAFLLPFFLFHIHGTSDLKKKKKTPSPFKINPDPLTLLEALWKRPQIRSLRASLGIIK